MSREPDVTIDMDKPRKFLKRRTSHDGVRRAGGGGAAGEEQGMKPHAFIPHWPFTKANPSHCNETVYARWHIDVVGHQCPYKKSVEIDGIGFCKVHARRYQP